MDHEQISLFRTALWNFRAAINSICCANSQDPKDTTSIASLFQQIRNVEYQFIIANPEEQKKIVLSFCQDILPTIELYGNNHKEEITKQVAPLPKKIRDLIITSKKGNTFPNGFRQRRDVLYKKLDRLAVDCFDPTNQINIYQILITITKYYHPPIQIPKPELDSIKSISESFSDLFILISHSFKVRELENQIKSGISIIEQRKAAEEKRKEDLKLEEDRRLAKKKKDEQEKNKLAQQTLGNDRIIENQKKLIADLEARNKALMKENAILKDMLARFIQIGESANCLININ